MSIPGVVGLGLGARITNGINTGEPCITVFVTCKWTTSKRKHRGRSIPREVRDGKRRLGVDVVEAGKLRLEAAGAPLGPVGVQSKGTLGAYGRDLVDAGHVAITAMHVSGLDEYPTTDAPTVEFMEPSSLDVGPHRLIGALRRGTRSGVDAALIALADPSEAWPVLPEIGPIRGWRPAAYAVDVGTSVRIYGASSGYQRGEIVNPSVSFPKWGIESGITAYVHTDSGDSGCALVDDQNLVLGFLVGQTEGSLRLFCGVSLVLYYLQCELLTLEP